MVPDVATVVPEPAAVPDDVPDVAVPDEPEAVTVPDDAPVLDPVVAVPELAPVAATVVPEEPVPAGAVPVVAPVPVVAIDPDDDPVLEDEPDEPLVATCVPLFDAQPW